jgi:hypothetical protein
MADTNTYEIISANAVGDVLTIVGTVNGGANTTVITSVSYLAQLTCDADRQSYVASLLLNAQPMPPLSQLISTGTFSQ